MGGFSARKAIKVVENVEKGQRDKSDFCLKDLRLRIFKWATNRGKLRKVEGVYPSFVFRTSLENTEVLMN